jgi:hypothetical protein
LLAFAFPPGVVRSHKTRTEGSEGTHATAQQMMVRGLIERRAATRYALTEQGRAVLAASRRTSDDPTATVCFRGQTEKLMLVPRFTVPAE